MFVSFYSYKGGVGRTQLLANIASYLCFYKHKKILIWDWDLEAPGAHFYFGRKNADTICDGTMELLQQYVEKMRTRERFTPEQLPYFTEENIIKKLIVSRTGEGRVDLIPCANYGTSFTHLVNDFNWREFMELLDGQTYLSLLKEKIKAWEYDFVLIDSRTGISDYSGLCNILLPDMNVFVIAPTEQNFEGTLKFAKAVAEHPYLTERKEDGTPYRLPYLLPILSRIDNEAENFKKWVDRFEIDFGQFVKSSLPENESENNEAFDFFIKKVYVPNTALLYNRRLALGENILFEDTEDFISKIAIQANYENITNYILSLSEEGTISNTRNNDVLSETMLEEFRESPRLLQSKLSQFLDTQDYAKFFSLLNHTVPIEFRSVLFQLRQEYILGANDRFFNQRLRMLIDAIFEK